MNKVILTAQNISKQYRLGVVGTGTLSHDINRWWASVRGKEDPYLKIGAENDRSKKAETDYVWALRDINFDVYDGDVLGIIGKNGAGKSTLLKILSRVTMPTTGKIKTKGRIASLLEVGTGFHPELTGRENIYLNGAILGMTKAEIKAKEEEIINFSGCELYVDTPVKRYSSGMRVRLAFAVAAHLEPDILVVDEVLAVGDAEFQKKAIGKMKDISGNDGRTVLFVSHNMAAVKSLCTRGIVLENGTSVFEGTAEESVDYYLSQNQDIGSNLSWNEEEAPGNDKIKLLSISVMNENDESNLFIDDEIRISYTFKSKIENSTLGTTISVSNQDESVVFSDGTLIFENQDSLVGTYTVTAGAPKKLLNSGSYYVSLIFGINKRYAVANLENIVSFSVNLGKDIKHNKRMPGTIYQELEWQLKKNE
ncbi:ABC transporter ATP-binding protein [Psychroflexus sediminis]|uniref:Lipopolysaccharide transport system ATP-binding protein n=1 Tax=Psychroflexus sediminis TaxID=470826 RepID=A0A1G7ZDD9_9FLAO|nr:ABC transporter ATP-binding protein [Psychroflexus sediminis]SDH06645.1 lipopolysaccharide transport system ATP-binding protein [Psychroflexus sediminis]